MCATDCRAGEEYQAAFLEAAFLPADLPPPEPPVLLNMFSPPSRVLFLEAGEESPPAPFDVPNYTVEKQAPEDCTNFCYKVSCNVKSGQICVCRNGDDRDQ